MSATIKIFSVSDRHFRHVMSSDHDSVELRDEHDRILLTYSGDAKVFDKNGRLGYFELEFLDGRPCWVFCEKTTETCIVVGADLGTAKVEVSKRYLRQSAAAC